MKKTSISFLAVGLMLCLSLFLGFLLLPPALPGANEVFSEAPVLFTRENGLNDHYFSELSEYYAQRFGFRQRLITVYNKASAILFGTSEAQDVILGKDGWLYYASTLDDFTGAHRLSNRELYAAANNLSILQESCDLQGISFAFLPIPNKNTLYPHHMPDYGAESSVHDLDRLSTLLEEMGVPVIDAASAFSGQSETLYFAHDSHWNSKGAALGADLINHWRGRDSRYFEGNFSATVPHTGDLYEMLYPTGKDPEEDPVYNGSLTFSYAPGSGTQPDSITIRTESGGDGSLFLYRDSFGNLLYPYLADSFGYGVFSRSNTYAVPQGFDCLVIELVERNLSYLIQNLPAVPAPERILRRAAPEGSTPLSFRSAPLEEYLLWEGTAPDADETSPVYLLTEDTAYRAFLLEDGRFAALLPRDAAVTAVSYCRGGLLTAYLAEKNEAGVPDAMPVLPVETAPIQDVPIQTQPVTDIPAETETDTALQQRIDAAKACIGKDVDTLYAAVGKPISRDYASSCLGPGEDGNLYYDGFTVYTYREGDRETVRYAE